MDKELISNLVRILWSPFLEEVRSKRPVTFSFHKDMVSQLLNESGIKTNDSYDFINSVARKLVLIDDDLVLVKPESMQPVWGKVSASIILVCQQILTVEEMSRDHYGFSEQAYFPRLRSAISEELDQESQNPYSYEEFEEIWRCFKSDIFELGGSSLSVTFRFGEFTNRDKARGLPFSQALLSLSDVHKLIISIGRSELKRNDRAYVSRKLYNAKNTVSRRGQKLLSLPWLKDSIIDQVLAHVDDDIRDTIKSNRASNSSQVEFETLVFKDSPDFYSTTYLPFPFQNGARLDMEPDIFREKLRGKLSAKGFLYLPRNEIGDAWQLSNEKIWVNSGDDLLIICLPSYAEESLKMIETISRTKLELSNRCQLSGVPGIDVLEISSIRGAKSGLLVKDGSLLLATEEDEAENCIWIGGLPLQRTNGYYHYQFPPTSISIGQKSVKLIGKAEINGQVTTFEHFFESLSSLVGVETFRIKIQNLPELKLQIAGKTEEPNDIVGFYFDETFDLVPSTLEKSAPCMRGFSLINCNQNEMEKLRKDLETIWGAEVLNGRPLSECRISESSKIIISEVASQLT